MEKWVGAKKETVEELYESSTESDIVGGDFAPEI